MAETQTMLLDRALRRRKSRSMLEGICEFRRADQLPRSSWRQLFHSKAGGHRAWFRLSSGISNVIIISSSSSWNLWYVFLQFGFRLQNITANQSDLLFHRMDRRCDDCDGRCCVCLGHILGVQNVYPARSRSSQPPQCFIRHVKDGATAAYGWSGQDVPLKSPSSRRYQIWKLSLVKCN